MIRSFIILLIFFLSTLAGRSQAPVVSSGTIVHYERFPSRYVQPRNVDVWLPEAYTSLRKYAVLYMHDGQMLFDSTLNWNRQEWSVDETLATLLQKGLVRNTIVVGVWSNSEYRLSEYFPQKPLNTLPATMRDSLIAGPLMNRAQADNYLRFLVRELKPFIDSAYATRRDKANTMVAGSSMGGLISLYAICEYPAVFGAAACLSTHWPGTLQGQYEAIPNAFVSYARQKLPSPKDHKIYFDYGTETLDRLYKPHQERVDKVMHARGYRTRQWITREFPGEDHSEKAWGRRLHIPLQFLLGQ
jgi:enterochelin esterase-like enzyme